MELSLYESILMFLFICISTIISIYCFVSTRDNNTKESFIMTQRCVQEEIALETCQNTYKIPSSNIEDIQIKTRDNIVETHLQHLETNIANLQFYETVLERINSVHMSIKLYDSYIKAYDNHIKAYDSHIKESSNGDDLTTLESNLTNSLNSIEQQKKNITSKLEIIKTYLE